MPEQFGLEQIFRNGRAIDRDKGLVPPVARIVQALGQQFLAGAARSQQHDRSIGVGDAFNHLRDLQHFRRAGDDLAQYALVAVALRGETGIFLFQPVDMKGAADDQAELVDIQGLLVKIPGTAGNCPQGADLLAMAGSHDHLGVRLQAQDRIHGGKAFGGAIGIRWQPQVQRHYIRLFRPQQFDGGLAVTGDQDFKIVIGPFQLLLQARIVFHDQQLFLFR